jgi:hypothetical protein
LQQGRKPKPRLEMASNPGMFSRPTSWSMHIENEN